MLIETQGEAVDTNAASEGFIPRYGLAHLELKDQRPFNVMFGSCEARDCSSAGT
jgi:hypothetical protein